MTPRRKGERFLIHPMFARQLAYQLSRNKVAKLMQYTQLVRGWFCPFGVSSFLSFHRWFLNRNHRLTTRPTFFFCYLWDVIELKPQPAIEHGQNQFLYYVHASVRLDISGKGEIYGDLEGFDATKVFFFVDLEQEKGLDRDEIRRICGPKKDFPECSMQVSFGDYNIGLRIRMACADEINPDESMVSKIHYDRGYSLRVTCTVDGENHLLDSLGRFNLRESGKSKEFDEWIESLAQQIIN